MSKDPDIRRYLHDLLDHEQQCRQKSCLTCQRAHELYQLVRDRMFASVVYPNMRRTKHQNTVAELAVRQPRSARM